MGYSHNNTNQTTVITIRIPNSVKTELQSDSETNHITLNANITKILIQHIERDRFIRDTEFICTNRLFLKQLFSITDLEDIEKIARKYCADNLKTTIVYMHGELNYNTFLQTLESWLRISGISFRRIENNDNVRYIVHHGLGKKWSHYLLAAMQTVAQEIGYEVDSKVEDSTLLFSLKNYERVA